MGLCPGCCPHEGWGQRATEAGSLCVPGTVRVADPAGTASSADAHVTNLGKLMGPCGLAGWGQVGWYLQVVA